MRRQSCWWEEREDAAILIADYRHRRAAELPPALACVSLPGVEELMRAAPGESDLFIPVSLQLGDHFAHLMTTILNFGATVDVNLEVIVVEYASSPRTRRARRCSRVFRAPPSRLVIRKDRHADRGSFHRFS